MKRIFLVRHAKSSWENYTSDKQRVLSEKGKIRATKMAKYMKSILEISELPHPDCWLSSTAVRAEETCKIFAEIFGVSYHTKEELYTFEERNIERFVFKLSDEYQQIALFGHNPALTEFVHSVGKQHNVHLSTSSVAMLTFAVDSWSKIEFAAETRLFIPKELGF